MEALSRFGDMEVDLIGVGLIAFFSGGGWGISTSDLEILDLQRLASLSSMVELEKNLISKSNAYSRINLKVAT